MLCFSPIIMLFFRLSESGSSTNQKRHVSFVFFWDLLKVWLNTNQQSHCNPMTLELFHTPSFHPVRPTLSFYFYSPEVMFHCIFNCFCIWSKKSIAPQEELWLRLFPYNSTLFTSPFNFSKISKAFFYPRIFYPIYNPKQDMFQACIQDKFCNHHWKHNTYLFCFLNFSFHRKEDSSPLHACLHWFSIHHNSYQVQQNLSNCFSHVSMFVLIKLVCGCLFLLFFADSKQGIVINVNHKNFFLVFATNSSIAFLVAC